jgi:hypothetical protein
MDRCNPFESMSAMQAIKLFRTLCINVHGTVLDDAMQMEFARISDAFHRHLRKFALVRVDENVQPDERSA